MRDGLGDISPRLWRYCLVLSGNRDTAEDLAQAACLRAIEKADQFEPGTHLDRWVFRIAQRMWLNDLRAQTVRRGGGLVSVHDTDLPESVTGEKMSPESNIFVGEVLSQVAALPQAQREAVMLVYIEGFSYKEAAEVLSIPIGTVMSRLAAARGKLAAKLAPQETKAI